jgi:hypothetical protein
MLKGNAENVAGTGVAKSKGFFRSFQNRKKHAAEAALPIVNAEVETEGGIATSVALAKKDQAKHHAPHIALTRHEREEAARLLEEKKNKCALVIQRAYRGAGAGVGARERIYEMVLRLQKEDFFALRLQRSWKRKKMRMYIDLMIRSTKAATKIQCQQRACMAKAKKEALVRARIRKHLETLSSTSLQAFARMAILRLAYLRELSTHVPCRRIQSSVRGRICRRWMYFLNWKKQWELDCLSHVQSLPLETLRLQAWVIAERGKFELRKAIKVREPLLRNPRRLAHPHKSLLMFHLN